MGSANVTIHVDEFMDSEMCQHITGCLRAKDGVESVYQSERRPHLMVTYYDSHEVTSMEFLQVFQSEGLHAQLIGF